MPTREEIREGIRQILAEEPPDGACTKEEMDGCPEVQTCKECALLQILELEDRLGVVIKVGRESSTPNSDCIILNGELVSIEELSKAGYVAVEPLIEE